MPYTSQGSRTFTTVAGSGSVVGTGAVTRYSVSVEDGLTGVDPSEFARQVESILDDPRGWTAARQVAFQRVVADADWQVTLTSALTVRDLCGYETPVETSCWDPGTRRVVINVARWTRGATAYVPDVGTYRSYAINHEVAHALGHGHAHQCLPDGRAPIMMQQSLGTKSTTGQLCRPNAWPYPAGVTGVPGVEEADTADNSQFILSSN